MRKKIGIIGLGNPLRRDDGVGLLLLQHVQKQKKNLPKNIEYIDGGISGMNLLHLLAQFDTVLLIDAVDFKGKPGDVRVFSLKDIRSLKKPVNISTHDSNFLNILRLSKELKELPETLVIFGVQPRDVSHGMGLSKEIEMILDDLCLKVQKEIQNLFNQQRR
jgi:hydrogenase maturation protease